MTTDAERERGLRDMIERLMLRDIDTLLDISPYMIGAPPGTRAQFWLMAATAVGAKYHDELERISADLHGRAIWEHHASRRH